MLLQCYWNSHSVWRLYSRYTALYFETGDLFSHLSKGLIWICDLNFSTIVAAINPNLYHLFSQTLLFTKRHILSLCLWPMSFLNFFVDVNLIIKKYWMITGQKPASIYCAVVLYCIPLAAFAFKNKGILESELIKPPNRPCHDFRRHLDE